MKEFETRILNINKEEIINKLKKSGAEEIHSEALQKRYIFDYPSQSLREKNAWVRLREVNNIIELSYKQRGDENDIEHTVLVDNLEETINFLTSIGLVLENYQENKRAKYKYGKTFFDIDTWPKLNPYIEIESDSNENVDKGLALLGYERKDTSDIVGEKLYASIGIDLKKIKELKF
ncbi:MAG: CYTH domain-containing protein [Patescibacteria group bacterium]|jgi:adenylate cyclase class 2|nr:CYTH domain-containing protein [Patescibacteria group bacterium]